MVYGMQRDPLFGLHSLETFHGNTDIVGHVETDALHSRPAGATLGYLKQFPVPKCQTPLGLWPEGARRSQLQACATRAQTGQPSKLQPAFISTGPTPTRHVRPLLLPAAKNMCANPWSASGSSKGKWQVVVMDRASAG